MLQWTYSIYFKYCWLQAFKDTARQYFSVTGKGVFKDLEEKLALLVRRLNECIENYTPLPADENAVAKAATHCLTPYKLPLMSCP